MTEINPEMFIMPGVLETLDAHSHETKSAILNYLYPDKASSSKDLLNNLEVDLLTPPGLSRFITELENMHLLDHPRRGPVALSEYGRKTEELLLNFQKEVKGPFFEARKPSMRELLTEEKIKEIEEQFFATDQEAIFTGFRRVLGLLSHITVVRTSLILSTQEDGLSNKDLLTELNKIIERGVATSSVSQITDKMADENLIVKKSVGHQLYLHPTVLTLPIAEGFIKLQDQLNPFLFDSKSISAEKDLRIRLPRYSEVYGN